MAYCPSLSDINNLFAATKNQFDKQIYAKFWQTNIYASMFPKMMYDLTEGRQPQVLTSTYEMPVEAPIGTAMGSIAINAGTGNSCLVDATVVKAGYTSRSYQLQTKAFESEVICLTDLQFDYQAEQQIANKQKGLAEFATRWWSSWYQAQLIGMVDNKISTLANCALSETFNSNYDPFGGLTLPTVQLEWCHIQPLYDRLARVGGEQFAVGMANGMPAYSLNLGPGYKRKLWQVDQGVRDTVNWGNAFENFTARGINTAVYGFIPNVELYPYRYDGSLRWIPPFINTDATGGRKSVPNPAYRTTANNGNAVYEVVSISARDIFEVRVRPTAPTSFGQASFDPVNYAGDVQWINNKDMCNNKLGNMGFYHLDIQVAPKPIFPDMGFSIITLALD
jgi:hypothetical protein